ncbi:hypothetical protein GCM10010411_53510 [Actinomadura fulvescens]|uniref:Uncharacterized protein n=1 Tax=Actinomadura fulvescens TaxID=46160 RepID=A0ABP6CCE2_9ACTN
MNVGHDAELGELPVPQIAALSKCSERKERWWLHRFGSEAAEGQDIGREWAAKDRSPRGTVGAIAPAAADSLL